MLFIFSKPNFVQIAWNAQAPRRQKMSMICSSNFVSRVGAMGVRLLWA